ncbi:MAG: DUF629 domain-containing protein [Candidatus Nitrosocaldus sp.]
MGKYMLKCRLCNESFISYEDYERHVVEEHRDNLAYRFKPMIMREEGEGRGREGKE